MARGVNKVILIGNLGADPEVRAMPSGSTVTNISLATTESWKDKQTGELQDRTEWHRVAFFNRLAEIVAQYARKGSKIYIEGALRTRKWQDKSGADRYTTEIIANEMQLLDSKGGGSSQFSQSDYQTQSGASQPPSHSTSQPQHEPAGDFEDDIPF